MNDGKTYRWLRVLEYVGTLGFINDAVAKRNIKGSKTLTKGEIRESFIGDTPLPVFAEIPERLDELGSVHLIHQEGEYIVLFRHQNSDVIGIATAKRNDVGWQECSEPGQPNIIQWWNPDTGRFEDWK